MSKRSIEYSVCELSEVGGTVVYGVVDDEGFWAVNNTFATREEAQEMANTLNRK